MIEDKPCIKNTFVFLGFVVRYCVNCLSDTASDVKWQEYYKSQMQKRPVDKVALEQVLLWVLQFFSPQYHSINAPYFYVYHQCYKILVVKNAAK
jgi:hypothetical protein